MIAQFLEPEEEGSVQRNPTDLAALTRSCKAFHSILNPALYRYNVKFQGSSAVFTAIDKYGIHGNANATVGTLRACQNAGADWKTRRLEKVPQIFPFFRGRFIPDGNDVLEMSPLHLAARNGLDEAVVFLLEHEARIDDWDEREWTPLFVAIYYGRVSTVKLLIARGACLAPAGFRYNALHLAALSGETGVVNHIANLLDANAKDGNGCTPLIYTILSPSDGKYAAIRCLLDHGADPVEPVQRDYGVTTPLNEAYAVKQRDPLFHLH
ncbi:hypothetical protein NKR23_g9028 [Pleurostoma richardsiae]|uniref:Ankyrin n=1 Tax=Pleurostoma richardsiae TaxID=41990 RepID=A0AA38RRM5_9PEZI|nr:hypothetical protein NKR23_g9028 [Pleurostoma richardsiae]